MARRWIRRLSFALSPMLTSWNSVLLNVLCCLTTVICVVFLSAYTTFYTSSLCLQLNISECFASCSVSGPGRLTAEEPKAKMNHTWLSVRCCCQTSGPEHPAGKSSPINFTRDGGLGSENLLTVNIINTFVLLIISQTMDLDLYRIQIPQHTDSTTSNCCYTNRTSSFWFKIFWIMHIFCLQTRSNCFLPIKTLMHLNIR